MSAARVPDPAAHGPAPDFSRARVLLVQPPFVQLNAPYPAPYYLSAFLRSGGAETRIADHSVELFRRVFRRDGVRKLFADARPSVHARLAREGSFASEPAWTDEEDDPEAFNLSRFFAEEDAWAASIDRLVAFLSGADREFGHLLSAANGVLPGGPRLDRFLQSVDGQPSADQAGLAASLMLADLADFIAVALDPGFSLARYAGSLAASLRRFSDVEPALDGYVLREFYEPLLQEEWARVRSAWAPTPETPFVLACTVPFPGCLAGALAAARSAKAAFGPAVLTIAGGGYPNTELRSISSDRFFSYFDFLCFDRGYGALRAVLDRAFPPSADSAEGADRGAADPSSAPGARGPLTARPLYRTVFSDPESGTLVGAADGDQGAADPLGIYARTDAEASVLTFPDYRGVDFSRYVRPVDDANPMHRLWSDGRWLKAYLAHGCYWRACAFCDVKLDYVRGFAPVDARALFRHLAAQAEATGVRGVHLVDEAAPVASLVALAQENRAAGLPLVFWGNVRFERDFTPEVAAVLAAGGLLGISAGIEVASERGLKRLGKGLTLADVVSACAAFKEAGILVHAYLIFGFWDEDEAEIVDSAETMRQLFRAGLVDSAFWHKFVLTRHSRIKAEHDAGRHAGLEVLPAEDGDFADNDLRFRGEAAFDRFSAPLDALAAAWMSGAALDSDVRSAFPFRLPAPRVRPGLVDSLLDSYARSRDAAAARPPAPGDVLVFLGGAPQLESGADGWRLRWRWRLESRVIPCSRGQAGKDAAVVLRGLLEGARPGADAASLAKDAAAILQGVPDGEAAFAALRAAGLALLPAAVCAARIHPL